MCFGRFNAVRPPKIEKWTKQFETHRNGKEHIPGDARSITMKADKHVKRTFMALIGSHSRNDANLRYYYVKTSLYICKINKMITLSLPPQMINYIGIYWKPNVFSQRLYFFIWHKCKIRSWTNTQTQLFLPLLFALLLFLLLIIVSFSTFASNAMPPWTLSFACRLSSIFETPSETFTIWRLDPDSYGATKQASMLN